MQLIRKYFTPALLLLGASIANAATYGVPSGQYVLEDTHGYITFSYSHLGFSTPQLGFDRFSVTLNADNENPENSTVAVTIDATSVNSRVDEFDEHLNGENFFDTNNFPQATFVSTGITPTGENTYDVTGNLTIKDVTRPVTLTTTINKAADHPMRKVPTIGMSGKAKILRSDFGLGRYVPAVGDEVEIFVTAELIKQ